MNSETLKKMKRTPIAFLCTVMAVFSFFASCADYETDMAPEVEMDEAVDPNGIVTVKKTDAGVIYFQLGWATTLEPVGWRTAFSKEVRALINYSELSEASEDFTKKVRVNWIEGIKTEDATEAVKPSLCDPVVLYTDWQTVFEDGYMTIHFAVQGNKKSIDKHRFSLLVDKNDPTRVYFLHDKNGDKGKDWIEKILAFRVSPFIPEAGDGGSPVRISFHWMSYDKGGCMIPFISGDAAMMDETGSDG